MNALAYRARRNQVDLRILAYRPSLEPLPEGHLRVVVQVVDHGRPIAEDPILVFTEPALHLDDFISSSRAEGWDIQPWERSH